MSAYKYTVVQHSAYGYKGDPQFERALEPASLANRRHADAVKKAGGALFDTYAEADKAAHTWMYPPGAEGIIPAAPGSFARKKIDGLAVYVPPLPGGLETQD